MTIKNYPIELWPCTHFALCWISVFTCLLFASYWFSKFYSFIINKFARFYHSGKYFGFVFIVKSFASRILEACILCQELVQFSQESLISTRRRLTEAVFSSRWSVQSSKLKQWWSCWRGSPRERQSPSCVCSSLSMWCSTSLPRKQKPRPLKTEHSKFYATCILLQFILNICLFYTGVWNHQNWEMKQQQQPMKLIGNKRGIYRKFWKNSTCSVN